MIRFTTLSLEDNKIVDFIAVSVADAMRTVYLNHYKCLIRCKNDKNWTYSETIMEYKAEGY
jgi:hypothetical protein